MVSKKVPTNMANMVGPVPGFSSIYSLLVAAKNVPRIWWARALDFPLIILSRLQRKVDRAVADLEAVFAYVDDMDVASKDAEEDAIHLRQLFTRLREHGLVINAEKCVFGASSIEFLGHRLSAAGVEPLPAHVAAVVDFPRPSTVKELQGFLGVPLTLALLNLLKGKV